MSGKNLGKRLGIDDVVIYTVLSRGLQAAGGLFSIFLVLKYLSKDEQGFYYTFLSLLSFQIFFELGLSNIIVQYVSHEFAHVSDASLEICHFDKLSKLSSILHFFTKWYLVLGSILILGLIIIGFVFFNKFSVDNRITWKTPWLILAFSTGAMFICTFFLAFLEGLGRIKLVSKIRLIQQVFNLALTCTLLISGAKLYTSGIVTAVISLIAFMFISTKQVRSLLLIIWKANGSEKIDYKEEILPFQWRIAVSWIGGYLIFQLFNPVIFAVSGAKAAGQMGATLSVLNGIISLSLSWVSTKVAYWCRLIALQQYSEFKKSFKATLYQSSFINLLGITVFYAGIKFCQYNYPGINNRFILPTLLGAFSLTFFFNNIINCWATYLRCFKKEPFLVQAITVGLLSSLSTIVLGKFAGISGIVWGYVAVTIIISFPMSYYIFKINKDQYFLNTAN